MSFKNDQSILSVSELVSKIKLILEDFFPLVKIRGEISNLRIQPSGHYYFVLKDEKSQIPVVLFKSYASKLKQTIKNGETFIVEGSIDVYLPRGSYQLIARKLERDGIGYWRKQFEELKNKLKEEGLFEAERKKKFPIMPKTIGVITSEQGAAIRDFISVIKRKNWKGKIIVIPATVQGENAPETIISAIKRAEKIKELDALVLTRGGGSIEDLWCFNDEKLVRALAHCKLPTITGIGHEIDYTLCDFVSDLRAETPTGAAELIANSFLNIQEKVHRASETLLKTIKASFLHKQHKFLLLGARMKVISPRKKLENFLLRLDDAQSRLSSAWHNKFLQKSHELRLLERRLKGIPLEQMYKKACDDYYSKLQNFRNAINYKKLFIKKHIQYLENRLNSLSFSSTLRRGFTAVKSKNANHSAKFFTSAKAFQSYTKPAELVFQDGNVEVVVNNKSSVKIDSQKKKILDERQGNLSFDQ